MDNNVFIIGIVVLGFVVLAIAAFYFIAKNSSPRDHNAKKIIDNSTKKTKVDIDITGKLS